jgi:hypothetical protein
MNPADLDSLEKADKDELLGIIEKMQTRDRCVRPWRGDRVADAQRSRAVLLRPRQPAHV